MKVVIEFNISKKKSDNFAFIIQGISNILKSFHIKWSYKVETLIDE